MLNNYREEPRKDEVLNFALHCANMDIDGALEALEMKKKEQIVTNHPFAIYQSKDGRWSTYVTEEGYKNHRKLIRKTSYEKLCDAIYEHHLKNELKTKKASEGAMSFKDFFNIWIKHKAHYTARGTTLRRIYTDFNKYYVEAAVSQPYVNRSINSFKHLELEEWMHDLCLTYKMTKTQYFNMSIIPRQMFAYAKEKGILEQNPFAEVKVSSTLFKRTKKPADETQVYYDDEREKIVDLCIEEFKSTGNTIFLVLPFLFQTGLRIGEVLALEFSDIDEKKHHAYIHQMQGRNYEIRDDKIVSTGHTILDMIKQNAEPRSVYLPPKALEYISWLKENYKTNNITTKFLFAKTDGNYIYTDVVAKHIARLCKRVGIIQKSAHKSRKTYISKLLDQGVSLNYIRAQVGHSDERTTLSNYSFNSTREKETEEKVAAILN